MNRPALAALSTALPLILAAPAQAQAQAVNHGAHAGHDMSQMQGMGEAPPPPPTAQPAAGGHDAMPGMDMGPAAADPHAGHDMTGTAGDPHAGHDMSTMQAAPQAPAPPATPAPAAAPGDHAADRYFDPAAMAAARAQLAREHGGAPAAMVLLNVGEWRSGSGGGGYRWSGEGWFGGDVNRLALKSEGEGSGRRGVDAAEVQALYSRAVGPYFNLQAGLRYDLRPRPNRTFAVLGFEGLAPYWFEVEGAVFVSDRGDVRGRLEGYYDHRITQRLILQPRAEVNLAAGDEPDAKIGSGISDAEIGLRLRYEVTRRFAPYVGLSYERKFGRTADFARHDGDKVEGAGLVIGVRAWF